MGFVYAASLILCGGATFTIALIILLGLVKLAELIIRWRHSFFYLDYPGYEETGYTVQEWKQLSITEKEKIRSETQ